MFRSGERAPMPADQGSVAVRLDDAARISGRLAHDFDNLLMGIMGFGELARAQVEPDSRAAQYLAELLGVAENARTITLQLRSFGRSHQRNPSPTRLSEMCGPSGISRFAEQTKGVGIEASLPSDLPPVAVGVEPLQIILDQLLRNAAEAMPNGGHVSVTARMASLTDGKADTLPAPLPAGDYVELTIADAGAGLPKMVAAQVGREPFVTTKTGRRGLGLPIVLRTLNAHNGALRIESSSFGTAIIVYLPSATVVQPAPLTPSAALLEVSPK